MRPAAWGIAVLLLCAGTADADEKRGELERWVPSLSVSYDIVGQHGSGEVAPSQVFGPPLSGVPPDAQGELGCLDPTASDPGNRVGDDRTPDGKKGKDGLDDLCTLGGPGRPLAPYSLQPFDEDTDTNVYPTVGGALELMSPALLEMAGRPRAFAHFDLAGTFGFERRLAGTGKPTHFSLPAKELIFGDINEQTVVGQGSRTNLKVGDLLISAGAGIAFTADAFGRRIRVKPSIEYVRQDIRYKGTVNRAVKLKQNVDDVGSLDDFRFVSLVARDEKILHGFGPGLEIEADTLRTGPFLMSVFLQGRGYYFPDTLDETLSAVNEWGESATWTFELEPWAWRSGVGLRFRWLPE